MTVARQAPPPLEFTRQEYWGGLPFPSPGELPDPGIEPRSPALQEDSLLSVKLGPRTLETRSISYWTAREIPHFLL